MIEIILGAVAVVLILGVSGIAVAGITLGGLAREIDGWADEGLVTREQAAELRARHAVSWAESRRDRFVRTLGILGAGVFGVGVILFFASNWSDIPRFARLAILIAGLVAFYGAGLYLRDVRRRHSGIGHAFIFLGVVLFGATLFLVDQMYHVQAHEPLPFLWWTIAAAGIAFLIRSGPLAGLASLTFFAWIGYELQELGGDEYGSETVFAAVLGLYGLGLYAAATFVRALEQRSFAFPMRMIGYSIAMIGVFILTFSYAYEWFGAEQREPRGKALAILVALAAPALLGGATLIARRQSRAEGIALALAAAALLLVVLVPQSVSYEESGPDTLWYPIVFNLLMALLAVGAIVLGFLRDEVWLVNAGLMFSVLMTIARFVDPQWGQLRTSFALMAAGAAVLGLAWQLERRRKAAPG